MSKPLESGRVVCVGEDSSYDSVFLSDCPNIFSYARQVLSCEYISCVFSDSLPDKYCLLVDDSAAINERGVSAIGTYLLGRFFESVPLYGPFLIVKYYENSNRQKEFSLLTEKEAVEVVQFLNELVPGIKNALDAILRKKKKEKFTVL